MSKLDLEIDPNIFTYLLEQQSKLPKRATGEHKKGAELSYSTPAGMALLGMKDGYIDTAIALKMSGGCWDAPNINYDDMDKGLRKLIKLNRVCSGMALLRHPDWHNDENEEFLGKIPSHLKNQIHNFRNSFEDISKTLWIILHNDYFRVYRATKNSEDGRVGAREISIKSLFDMEKLSKDSLVYEKFHTDNEKAKIKIAKKKELEIARQKAAEEAEKLRLASEEKKRKEEEKLIQKKAELNLRLKDKKDAMIDAGNGLVFMKDKNGEYILWRVK